MCINSWINSLTNIKIILIWQKQVQWSKHWFSCEIQSLCGLPVNREFCSILFIINVASTDELWKSIYWSDPIHAVNLNLPLNCIINEWFISNWSGFHIRDLLYQYLILHTVWLFWSWCIVEINHQKLIQTEIFETSHILREAESLHLGLNC